MSHPVDITIYTGTELNALPKVLHDVVQAINLAFSRHESFFPKPRFFNPDELLEMLGPEGRCAVIHSHNSILASACIIPWSPPVGTAVAQALEQHRPNDALLVAKGRSYEIKTVITADTPEAKGKGLIGPCIEELVGRVRRPGESELLIWVRAVEHLNGAYWRRRGYELVGELEIKGKGSWNSVSEFEYATMAKRISWEGRG
jgi:hypothetical protein